MNRTSSRTTLIKHGTVVTASDEFTADVFIEGETIALIGANLDGTNCNRVIDARGKYILPGGVDVHTHLDTPGGNGYCTADDYFTGHRAAAFGGTTTVLSFADQWHGASMRQTLDEWHSKARGKAAVDYGFHLMVTDCTDAVVQELAHFREWGVNTVKLMMAYKGRVMVDDGVIFRVMQRCKELGLLTMVHCENGEAIDVLQRQAVLDGNTSPIFHALTRPPQLEAEATERAIQLARAAGGAPLFVVHCTHEGALAAVSRARSRGEAVWCETCIHYLYFTKEKLKGKRGNTFDGAKYVCSPPLREETDIAALWHGLAHGELHSVSTDHCPWRFDVHKSLGREDFTKIPNGAPAIEERLMMLWDGGVNTGRITPSQFVGLACTEPARLFGMPHKGSITVGKDADIVIWDPKAQHTIRAKTNHGAMDYSLFEGTTVTGKPVQVISRGELIVDGTRWLGEAGRGQFLERSDKPN